MAIYCTEGERCLYDDRSYWNALPQLAPSVVFHTRIRTGILLAGKTYPLGICLQKERY